MLATFLVDFKGYQYNSFHHVLLILNGFDCLGFYCGFICILELFFFLEVRKILLVENLVGEKRRERLHIGECRGTQKLKPVIP
jgi:hypothetical protein